MAEERTLSSSFKSQPIAVGRSVSILRLGQLVAPHVEGRAFIKSPGREPDQYWVSFPGDPVNRLRLVFEHFQSEASIGLLRRLYRAEAGYVIDDVPANDNNIKGRVR